MVLCLKKPRRVTGWKSQAPARTVSQVQRLLEVVLPLKVFHADDVLHLVAGMQQHHELEGESVKGNTWTNGPRDRARGN